MLIKIHTIGNEINIQKIVPTKRKLDFYIAMSYATHITHQKFPLTVQDILYTIVIQQKDIPTQRR